jgi:hypothetical protein
MYILYQKKYADGVIDIIAEITYTWVVRILTSYYNMVAI